MPGQTMDRAASGFRSRNGWRPVWWTAFWETIILSVAFAVTGFSGVAVAATALITFWAVYIGYCSILLATKSHPGALCVAITWGAILGAAIGSISALIFCCVIEVPPVFSLIGTVVGVILGPVDAAIWKDAGALDGHTNTKTASILLFALLLISSAPLFVLFWDGSGTDPLISAIDSRNLSSVDKLLAGGADPNSFTEAGDTALIRATANGDIRTIDTLCAHGADVNGRSKDGFTALHYAAGMDDPQFLRVLIEKGANIDVSDANGWTPLITAAYQGYLGNVNLLLEKRANVHLKNKEGKTALAVSRAMGAVGDYPRIVQVLEKAGAKD